MISQAELKRLRALHDKKGRGVARRFLAQGRKVVCELLRSSYEVELVLASEEAAAFLAAEIPERRVPVRVLAGHELEKVGTLERGNELVAVAVTREPPPFRAPAPDELVLALDGVRDPRNMGGLLRIADWFGVRRVVCSHDCMEVENPKCVQSTMGSLFRVEVRRARLDDELGAYAAAGAAIYLADMDGAPVYDVPLVRPAVLVLGSESHGPSTAAAARATRVVSIPRVGGAESLNVAMAAAALCSELCRRARG